MTCVVKWMTDSRSRQQNYQPTGAPVPAVVEAYGPYGFSSSLADEAFKPACCLTDTYIDASVKELRDGLENLQKRSQKKGNSQKVSVATTTVGQASG